MEGRIREIEVVQLDKNGDSDRRGIQSVEIGMRVLDALAGPEGGIPLKSISKAADMTASKAHRYLSSFVRTGLVRQDPATGWYELGPQALRLGLAALASLDVVRLASEHMRGFARETGFTLLLSVYGESGPTVIRWERGARSLMTSLSLGSVLPLLTSATGKIFLAYLPRTVTQALVQAELKQARRHAGDVRTLTDVKQMIENVRVQGHASADGNVIPGLRALSMPILDAQDEAAAVITMLSSSDDLLNPSFGHHESLKRLCDEVSRQAGAGTGGAGPVR